MRQSKADFWVSGTFVCSVDVGLDAEDGGGVGFPEFSAGLSEVEGSNMSS